MLKTCQLRTAAMLVLGLVGLGCDRGNTPAPGGSSAAAAPDAVTSAASPALPPGLFAAAEPLGARGVLEIKAAPQVGDEVTVRGRIGGRTEPFVEGRAMFTLVELALPTCNEKHGDGCPTPWDYCCEPATEVVRQSLTVQVPGADGKALRAGLAGTHGLKPMAEIVVTGRIAKVEEGGIVVVDARQIWVKG